eukprot:TRINITY_DN19199_c0_g1_i2.p1 TRINITY_DN19199_c0_g1~~TRINITY_DN19199_c0_g1_i2.p1  ORF type:complete len:343 (+),score=36.75 TRINITY_DN19199_c0_g1_i2:96-1124(+)
MMRWTSPVRGQWKKKGCDKLSAFTDAVVVPWRSSSSLAQKAARMRYEFDRVRLTHEADQQSYELLLYYTGVKCRQYNVASSCAREAFQLMIPISKLMITTLFQSAALSASAENLDNCWDILMSSGIPITPDFAAKLLECVHQKGGSEESFLSVFQAIAHLGVFDDCLDKTVEILLAKMRTKEGLQWFFDWSRQHHLSLNEYDVKLGLQAAGRASDCEIIEHFFYDILPEAVPGSQLTVHHYTWLFLAYAAASSIEGCTSAFHAMKQSVSLSFHVQTAIRWITAVPLNEPGALQLMTDIANLCKSNFSDDDTNGRLNETLSRRSKLIISNVWSMPDQFEKFIY